MICPGYAQSENWRQEKLNKTCLKSTVRIRDIWCQERLIDEASTVVVVGNIGKGDEGNDEKCDLRGLSLGALQVCGCHGWGSV